MALILTRSPYHISRGTLDANAGLDLEISTNVDGVSTILNSYTINFRNKTHIDISSIVSSEFNSTDKILYVKITVSGTINGVSQSDSVSNYYASNGYLYSSDNYNEDFSSTLRANGYYTGSSDVVYKLSNSSLSIPLLNTSLTTLMDNKVGNPAFDSSTDWQIQSGDVIEDGVLKCNGTFGGRNYLGFNPTTGLDYKVSFEISNYTSGDIAFFTGSGGTRITDYLSANGSYEFNYTQDATTLNMFSLYSPSGFVGHIDNVFLGERTSTNYEEVTIDAKYNGSTVETRNLEFDSDTNTANQEVKFNIDDIDEVIITTDYGSKLVKVNPITECKYSPYILTFKNRYGVDEDLWFFKKSKRKLTVKGEDFRFNQLETRIAGGLSRSMQEYNKNGKESITLNSGFVVEALNESFKQLLLSEEVKLYDFDNSSTQAVKLSLSSLDFKTVTNDKLINYTIEVEFSNNIIDDIV